MNDHIEKIRALLDEAAGSVSEIISGESPSVAPESSVRQDRRSNIVSQSQTHVELGHPSVPSAALMLGAHDCRLIHDGRITIAGTDIGQLEKGRYSFAQVVLVGGAGLKPEHLLKAGETLSAAGQLDGCMVRLMDGKIWARVSTEAVRNGFSFRIWGEHLLRTIRDRAPAVESVEVIFFVDMHEHVGAIAQVAGTVNEKRRKERVERIKERTGKDYECDNPYDCNSCPDKPDCDVLKEVAQEVRKQTLQTVVSDEGGE